MDTNRRGKSRYDDAVNVAMHARTGERVKETKKMYGK
jgi:hypothetical protein